MAQRELVTRQTRWQCAVWLISRDRGCRAHVTFVSPVEMNVVGGGLPTLFALTVPRRITATDKRMRGPMHELQNVFR